VRTLNEFIEFERDREGRTVQQQPQDPGLMTADGISRRWNPGWEGWELVDRGIVSGPEYDAAVQDFYRRLLKFYWDSMKPRLREAFCDCLVNLGPGKKGDKVRGAVELLQHAMNRLAGSDYVVEDGIYGPQTRAALNTVDPSSLAYCLCAYRLSEYGQRARHGSKMRWALDGWINRVLILMEAI
jgi:lysozyme family protein